MSLVLTEEQQILRQTAEEFVAANLPVTQLRKLRDSKDARGYDADVWKQMAELGWCGLIEAEEHGGVGMGHADLGIVLEELGRTLAATPLFATVLLGGGCVRHGGSDALKKEILTGVAGGTTLLALALDEGPRFAPFAVATKAEADGDGVRISGEKVFVIDGHIADRLVVVARSAGVPGDRDGLTLAVVDRDAPGVTVTRTAMVDNRNAARVRFENVAADAGSILGTQGQGAAVLDRVLEEATAGLCAEMLGSARQGFDTTIEYLKTREQFGVKIGTFQALKHRAAAMFAELELSRSITMEALRAIDENGNDVANLVAVAKARLSDTANLVSREMLQMHGGIGMTDEADIGFYLKRAQATEQTLGDGDYHRDRFATLQGY